MRVLIADDDPVSRRLLEAFLRGWDYDVRVAVNGRQAWEALQSPDAPRLVISDWMMPEMNGLELCRLIRGAESPTYTYFIILTAKDSREDVVAGLEAGADDYLVKPFNRAELKCRIGIGERILHLEEKILKLATTDALTGLLNRPAVLARTRIELNRARRESKPCSLLMADIDHFKQINDTFGHQVGDAVLEKLGDLFLKNSRPYDCLGRYGGEEFVACLPGSHLADALQAAERLRAAVSKMQIPTTPALPEARITVSFGVACLLKGSGADLDDLIRRADEALYRAKAAGRNRVMADAAAH